MWGEFLHLIVWKQPLEKSTKCSAKAVADRGGRQTLQSTSEKMAAKGSRTYFMVLAPLYPVYGSATKKKKKLEQFYC